MGLKSAVMSKDSGGSTALTSKQQKRYKKVGAHGMGGVGKTTIAVALVNSNSNYLVPYGNFRKLPQAEQVALVNAEEILRFFDYVTWVSLGQDPDFRELQSSVHFQLTNKELPDSAKTDREAATAKLRGLHRA